MDPVIGAEPALRVQTVAPIAGTGPSPFHTVLREATLDVHQRLHLHDGFAAIQNATIDLASYRSLLLRLYGFYIPFEATAGIGAERSGWLADDLKMLGVDSRALGAAPLCQDIPGLDTAEARLGALYVVEGSALGGRELGRNIARVLGRETIAGRRFFLGRGAGTGAAWRAYLAKLSDHSSDPASRVTIIDAALETFAVFERWMSGWRGATRD